MPVIKPSDRKFIETQRMFFVASAAREGRVNVSPKGMDTFRVLDDETVAYLDLTGSGNETAAHIRESGRITFMFCAFEGKPNIVRLYGQGEAVARDSARWTELAPHFPRIAGERQIIVNHVATVTSSCGFSIPFYEYKGERDKLLNWAEKMGEARLEQYRQRNNVESIDGLPTGYRLHEDSK